MNVQETPGPGVRSEMTTEAKLARALAALREIGFGNSGSYEQHGQLARAAIAEIEGEAT